MYHFVSEQTPELRLSENVLISSHITQYLKCFQLEAVRFLHDRLSKQEFCIFNDESGLGKCASIVALLNGLGTDKKTLIVLQNDDHLLAGWQFHLGVLTDLPVCVLKDVNDTTESAHSVYLSKWSILRSIGDLTKLKFDYIIVDHRGYTLNNNFCTSMLLKQFERKVNIVISSADITSDVKLLYNVLRLGGSLDHQYRTFQSFERKFHLPDVKEVLSKRVDLEEYYRQRGVLGEFIKEFRLRRYHHQFESLLPLVTTEQYKINLSLWLGENNSNSTISQTTIESSSEALSTGGTDEIFECLMKMKREREFADREDDPEKMSVSEYSDEVIGMEPLVFQLSDSEAEEVVEVVIADNDATVVPMPMLTSSDVVLLSSDDCEIVTPPTTPTRLSSPATKSKRKYTKRSQIENPADLTESETETETEEPTPSKSKSRKLNVKLVRLKEPLKVIEEVPTNSKKSAKSTQLKTPLKSASKKPQEQPVELRNKPELTSKKSPEKTTKKLTESPSKNLSEVKPTEPVPQRTRRKTTPVKKSLQPTIKKPQDQKTPLRGRPSKKGLPITPKTEKLVTPKTEPRSKRSHLRDMNSDEVEVRQTRGMQRLTRSADSRMSKYMAPLKSLEFEKRGSPKVKRRIDVNRAPKRQIEMEKKEDAVTPKKTNGRGRPPKNKLANELSPPTTSKKKEEIVDATSSKKKKEDVDASSSKKKKEDVDASSSKKQKQDVDASSSKKKKQDVAPSVATPELLSSSSNISDNSYLQCAQKLPDNLTELESFSDFRIPLAPQATPPMMLPATLNFFSDSEVVVVPNSNAKSDVVMVNSSNDESSQQSSKQSQSRRTRALKRKVSNTNKDQSRPSTSSFGLLQRMGINKSPDLFSNCSDLSQITLAQPLPPQSPFEGFKIFGSEVKQLQQQHAKVQQSTVTKKHRERSCLDLLENMFDPQKKGNETGINLLPNLPSPEKPLSQRRFTLLDDDIFEITNNGEFGSRLRLNSTGDVSPVHQQQQPQQLLQQRNKITKYLISSGCTPEDVVQRTQPSQAQRKSPKSIKSTQSTKLTRWFNSAAATGTVSGSGTQSAPSTPVVPDEKATAARIARSGGPTKRKQLNLFK